MKKSFKLCLFFLLLIITFCGSKKVSANSIYCGVYTKQSSTFSEKTGSSIYGDSDSTYLCGQKLYAELMVSDGASAIDYATLYIDGTPEYTLEDRSGESDWSYSWASHAHTFYTTGVHTCRWVGKWYGSSQTFDIRNTIYLNTVNQESYSTYNYSGDKVNYAVTISGVNPSKTYSYQWYYATSLDGSKTKITGATKSTYSFTASSSLNDRYYYCYVSNGYVNTYSSPFHLYTKYKISYDANNGSNAPSYQTKYHNSNIKLSSVEPTREGYEFLGWSTSSTATSANPSYAPGSTYSTDANLTLYAVWKLERYVITYDANGGKYAPGSQTKDCGITITLSQSKPTKEGYTFLGWSTSRFSQKVDYNPGDTYSEDKDMALYAVWKTIEYNVTYDMNGGTGYISNQTKYYGIDLTLTNIIPTKTGSIFLGWAKSRSSTEIDYYSGETYRLNESINLYAVWKTNEYEVKYDANGGLGVPGSQIKEYGISIKLSDMIPSRDGYDFLGWTIISDSDEIYYFSGDTYSLNADVTLYAVWRIKEYTIRYDANGGSGEPEDQKKEYGNSITLSYAIPTKTGSKFIGWSTDNTGTTIEYDPGAVYSIDENVTLYAVWESDYKKPAGKKTSWISSASNIKKEYGTKKFNLKVKTNSNGKITYKISNSKVAAIDKNGNVKIKGYGKAVITVKVAETSKYKAKSKKISLCIVPDAVKNFKAESTSKGLVKFTWKGTKLKNAKCQIQASLTSDFEETMTVPSPSITKGKYIAKGLKSGKTYYFRIRVAVKASGKKYYSDWIKKKVRIK